MNPKICLFSLTLSELKALATSKGYPAYRMEQLFTAVYAKGILSLNEVSTLPASLKVELEELFDLSLLKVESSLDSVDGSQKLLLTGAEPGFFECVIMPTEKRQTLCISCQAGCRMGCTFCQTGKLGLVRQLPAGEIVAQVLLANQRFPEKKVTHIVFMGMGEPLDNLAEVKKAVEILCDPKGLALLPSHITISTCGLVPEIRQLLNWLPVKLAISFHTPFDKERNAIMPVNRRYPLAELKAALLEYQRYTDEAITLEYVMIDGKNDSLRHAAELVRFIHGMRAKVNLIPMNSHPGSPMQSSSAETISSFQSYLSARSIPAPVRYSRGADISGACGQLASKKADELLLDPRQVAFKRRSALRNQGSSNVSCSQ